MPLTYAFVMADNWSQAVAAAAAGWPLSVNGIGGQMRRLAVLAWPLQIYFTALTCTALTDLKSLHVLFCYCK